MDGRALSLFGNVALYLTFLGPRILGHVIFGKMRKIGMFIFVYVLVLREYLNEIGYFWNVYFCLCCLFVENVFKFFFKNYFIVEYSNFMKMNNFCAFL